MIDAEVIPALRALVEFYGELFPVTGEDRWLALFRERHLWAHPADVFTGVCRNHAFGLEYGDTAVCVFCGISKALVQAAREGGAGDD